MAVTLTTRLHCYLSDAAERSETPQSENSQVELHRKKAFEKSLLDIGLIPRSVFFFLYQALKLKRK